jgi:cytochrome c
MRALVLDVTPEETAADAAVVEAAAQQEAAITAEPAAVAAQEEAVPEPVGASVDPALIAEGMKVFRKCKSCHQVGDGAKNRSGPILNGLIGAPAGHIDGFKYSKPLMAKSEEGLVWNAETLAGFLAAPKTYIKGTKMGFAGLKDPADIEAVIAYLTTFSDP